jgi:hypothetical protein
LGEIVEAGDFRGGVAFEREKRIVVAHAGAVVAHLD